MFDRLRFSDLRAGMTVATDDSQPDVPTGIKTVREDEHGFYLTGRSGKHRLIPEDGETLTGVFSI